MLNCVCFPGKAGNLRSDEAFKKYEYDSDFQTSKTILNEIPRLGLVSGVPLDPMHLLYLGVMRKLILIWLFSSRQIYKLPSRVVDNISKSFLSLRNFITNDFVRKPRALKYIKYFKATELRLILLYTGVIVFKNYSDPNVYLNYLTLHVAVTIANNPIFCRNKELLNYAEKLLEKFVEDFEYLYSANYVSPNIHYLLHLISDVRKYGQLENFSAFRFENHIWQLKKMIRKGDQPLQQLMRRCAEIDLSNNVKFEDTDEIFFSKKHYDGPLTDSFETTTQYKIIKTKQSTINCADEKNHYIMIDNKIVANILNIVVSKNNEIFFVGKQMKNYGDFYNLPIPSSQLGINIVDDGISRLESWNVNKLT